MYSPAVFCQIINIMLNRGGELDCMRICDFFLDLVFSVVFDGFVGCDGFVFLDYVCDWSGGCPTLFVGAGWQPALQ